MKRIFLLALLFVSVAEFALEHGRIDLLLMTAALAFLLWSGLRALRRTHTARKQSSQVASKEAR